MQGIKSTDANFYGFARYLYQEGIMFTWVIIFFVIALIAAVFGFTGIASAAAGVGKIIFFIALILFVISLIFQLLKKGKP